MPYKVHEWSGAPVRDGSRVAVRGIGPAQCQTEGGLALGVVLYHSDQYGDPDSHEQEAAYVVSGNGLLRSGSEEISLAPGDMIYLATGEPHAVRRTGPEPVKLVWAKSGGE